MVSLRAMFIITGLIIVFAMAYPLVDFVYSATSQKGLLNITASPMAGAPPCNKSSEKLTVTYNGATPLYQAYFRLSLALANGDEINITVAKAALSQGESFYACIPLGYLENASSATFVLSGNINGIYPITLSLKAKLNGG